MTLLFRIDDWLIDTYQRRIGDPLQERGIGLLWQWRAAIAFYLAWIVFVLALCVATRSYWMAGLLALFFVDYLRDVVWPSTRRQDRLTWSGDKTRNPYRISRRASRVAAGILAVAFSCLPAMYGWLPQLLIFLSMIIDACDPKPREPKRVNVDIRDAVPSKA